MAASGDPAGDRPDPVAVLVEREGLGDAILKLPFLRAIRRAASLRAVIASDSGLGHLFGAAGRPVVSLFGPTDPRRWAPVTPAGRIVKAQDFGGLKWRAYRSRRRRKRC